MSEFATPTTDPRWGADKRNIKAEQIAHILENLGCVKLEQSNVLDIGCGSGGIAAHLAPRVESMTGMDPEPWPRWAEWLDAHPNLKFLQGSVESNNLKPHSFDVIICNQVYEHVPDPQALIQLIARLIKPEGIVYFAGPNLLFPIEPHVFWPFVHWIPRELAIKIMKAFRAKYIDYLDAYSTHYWKLKSWLSPQFEIKNAIPFLIRETHPAIKDKKTLTSHIPSSVLSILTPLTPGFVFLLKPRKNVMK